MFEPGAMFVIIFDFTVSFLFHSLVHVYLSVRWCVKDFSPVRNVHFGCVRDMLNVLQVCVRCG